MSKANPDDLPYRKCAGMAVFNKKGRVFIGRRFGGPEHVAGGHEWQMPQGGIDKGEDPRAAAIREVYEETSMQSLTFLKETPDWLSYDLPETISGKAWKGRYRGQTMKWFAFRFDGDDAEINVTSPGGGHHKAEFESWRWEKLDRTPDLIIPFKRGVYEEVCRIFSEFSKG